MWGNHMDVIINLAYFISSSFFSFFFVYSVFESSVSFSVCCGSIAYGGFQVESNFFHKVDGFVQQFFGSTVIDEWMCAE